MRGRHYITGLLLGLGGCQMFSHDEHELELALAVEARLESMAPDLAVTVVDPLTVQAVDPDAGEHTINLGDLERACRQDPEGCGLAVDDYARMVLESIIQEREAPSRAQVLATLKSEAWISGIRRIASEQGDGDAPLQLVIHPFVADLYVVYVIDRPTTISMLTPQFQRGLGISDTDLPALATANLEARYGVFTATPLEGTPGVKAIRVGDTYEAARLLLHERWAPLAEDVPGDLVACAPLRDLVLFAGTDTPGAIDAMRFMAVGLMRSESYPLSSTLLRWTPQGWVPFRN